MAMTTCKECGKQVSTEAKACPHCGTSAPAKKKAKGGIGKWLLIVFAIGLVAMILPKQDKATPVASAPPKAQAKSPPPKKAEKVLPEECKITKKDGTLDARECDLEELCKDWVSISARLWNTPEKATKQRRLMHSAASRGPIHG